MKQTLASLLEMLLSPTSIWSIVLRGAVWLVLTIAIMVYLDNPRPEENRGQFKANLGFSLMAMILAGGLIYFLFSFTT